MGTRSNIGLLHCNGTVTMNYCHWDGYPSNNGKLLLTHYNALDRVLELLELGNLSSLGDTTKTTCAYHRDRDEELRVAMEFDSVGQAINSMEEYMYLFDIANHKWVFYSTHRDSQLRELTLDLCVD